METPSKHQVRCGSSSLVGEASDWCTNAAKLLGPDKDLNSESCLSGTGAEERARDPEECFKMFQSCPECTT